jgi:ketosteroid isomerase-like protein
MRRQLAWALTAALSLFASAAAAQTTPPGMTSTHVLEIRSYTLEPGTRDRFNGIFLREALPMLRRWKIDVVAYGPSRHDADSYFLMRAFRTVDERQRIEDAFYSSEEWRRGPREAVLAPIVSYTTVVIAVDEDTLTGLRRTMQMQNAVASDLDTLVALNDDYIRSVQTSDVRRFERILADDFLACLSDGSLLDRARFLEYAAKPATISNLAAHDVNVRLMGDFAIIHARTTFTLADGRNGEGRYTDVWARRRGQWLAVAAHVTRK